MPPNRFRSLSLTYPHLVISIGSTFINSVYNHSLLFSNAQSRRRTCIHGVRELWLRD